MVSLTGHVSHYTEECPVDAIKADTEPGLEKWLSLNAEYAKVSPRMTVKKAPPPELGRGRGSRKTPILLTNTGAGD